MIWCMHALKHHTTPPQMCNMCLLQWTLTSEEIASLIGGITLIKYTLWVTAGHKNTWQNEPKPKLSIIKEERLHKKSVSSFCDLDASLNLVSE